MREDFRKTAPSPLAPKPFDIPKPFETVLSNGLKIVIFENNQLPLVSYRLAFRSGDINDPKDATGLTSAMTSLLNEGTTTRSSKQIAEEIERLGAKISAGSSADYSTVSASTLSLYKSDVLKLLADITLHPTFPEEEIALFQKNTIQGLESQRANASFLANEQVDKILYGEHPYSVVSPSKADIEKISQEHLIALHANIFVPNNAIFIIVGDVNRAELLQEIEDNFGDWEQKDIESIEFSALPTRTTTTLTVVDRPGSAQSNIVLANLAIARTNPDYFPVLLMNQVLGAGASSRLFMNLREEKGYTYGAYSRLDTRRLAGSFEATAEVRTPVTGDSLHEFFYELNRIRDEKVSEKELNDAKNFLTGVFPLRAETQEGLTNLIVSQKLYDLPEDYLQTYRENVNAVTLDEVEQMAKKYITPDKIAIVVVGDAEEILPQVKSYSDKIEVFDTEGNQVDVAKYGKTTSGETANVDGIWDLTIEAQGQQLPVTLELKQEDAKVVGSLESMLGSGEITNGKVNGSKFVGTAKTQIQGQDIDLTINGTIDGNSMNGVINAEMPGFPPLPFEGNRANSSE